MPRGRRLFPSIGVLGALTLPLGAAVSPQIRLGEFQVNGRTLGAQYRPRVASDADGDFVVVWHSNGQDGSQLGVFGRRYSSVGAALASEFQVNAATMSSQYMPSVAATPGGAFVVAWSSPGDGSAYGVFARPFSSVGAALATEFQVNVMTSGIQGEPAVAAAANGDFVVAWSGPGDGSVGVFARRFSSAGTALTAELQVNTETANNQYQPSAAAEADGDFIVVWTSEGQDGAGLGVFARRFSSAGSILATEFQINLVTDNHQFMPSVAAEPDGDFVVGWMGGVGDAIDIFARRFSNAGAPLTGEIHVPVFVSLNQDSPSVSTRAGGDFVIVWHGYGQDYHLTGVVGRRFSSAGVALAVEFQVNDFTLYGQSKASVAVEGGGDFVVAWQSNYQDGSGTGVFAQRFDVPIILDIDGNESFQALTDGLLVLRYAFGFRGPTLVAGAVDLLGCSRCDAASIEAYLATLT